VLPAAQALRFDGFQSKLFGLLFISFPQFAYQMQFSFQSHCIAFGLLLASLALLVFGRCSQKNALSASAAALPLMICCVGIYQSLILALVSLAALSLLVDLLSEDTPARLAFKKAFFFIAAAAVASAVSHFVGIFAADFFGVQHRGKYLYALLSWNTDAPLQVLGHSLHILLEHLRGNAFYGQQIIITLLVPLLVVCVRIVTRKKAQYALLSIIALSAFILSPFAMTFLVGGWLPPRAFLSQGLVFAGLWAVSARNAHESEKFLYGLAAALLILASTFYVSRLFFADQYAWEADKQLATSIVREIYRAQPDFKEHHTPVFLYGTYSTSNHRFVPRSDTFGGSFFTWDGGNPARMQMFMKVNGIADLRILSPTLLAKYQEKLQKMPAWPHPKAVEAHEGAVLVKLSEEWNFPIENTGRINHKMRTLLEPSEN
jgi:hypothetical protein